MTNTFVKIKSIHKKRSIEWISTRNREKSSVAKELDELNIAFVISLRIWGVSIFDNKPAGPFQNVVFSLRTWWWYVVICFSESNNQPLDKFIACFKDSVDKMCLSRWPGNWNGFRQWEVNQILLRFYFIRLFWSNNQLKGWWHFCLSQLTFASLLWLSMLLLLIVVEWKQCFQLDLKNFLQCLDEIKLHISIPRQ